MFTTAQTTYLWATNSHCNGGNGGGGAKWLFEWGTKHTKLRCNRMKLAKEGLNLPVMYLLALALNKSFQSMTVSCYGWIARPHIPRGQVCSGLVRGLTFSFSPSWPAAAPLLPPAWGACWECTRTVILGDTLEWSSKALWHISPELQPRLLRQSVVQSGALIGRLYSWMQVLRPSWASTCQERGGLHRAILPCL